MIHPSRRNSSGSGLRIRNSRLALGLTPNHTVKCGAVEYEKIADYAVSIMPEVSADQLRQAVESQHGGTTTLLRSVPIHDEHGGQVVWDGVVRVFKLAGHSKATCAYAWSSPIAGSTKRRLFAVLDVPLIMSPLNAVRTAIVTEARAGK
jgi:hypothetical protein